MDVFAYQIHTDGGPDGGDVIGAKQGHHLGQGFQHIRFGDDDFRVVRSQIVCHFPGVFQVDGIDVHADGESADGLFAAPGGHGTDQTGIQTAGQKKAHRGVCVQPLFNSGGKLLPNLPAGGFQIIFAAIGRGTHVPVADEFAVLIVVPGREGHDLGAQPHQVLGLAGENDLPVPIIAIVQRPDADGVPGGDEGLAVKEDHGKFRVQLPEHLHAHFGVQRQQNFAVRAAVEDIALLLQTFPDSPEAVDFAVAHQGHIPPDKGLHSHFVQAHDGQPVEAQKASGNGENPAHIRPPGEGAVKIGAYGFRREPVPQISDDRTHGVSFFL